jgi:hypothetical protein
MDGTQPEFIYEGCKVVGIGLRIRPIGRCGRGIEAPVGKGDAGKARGKIRHLLEPGEQAAAQPMSKDKRWAFPGDLIGDLAVRPDKCATSLTGSSKAHAEGSSIKRDLLLSLYAHGVGSEFWMPASGASRTLNYHPPRSASGGDDHTSKPGKTGSFAPTAVAGEHLPGAR